MKPELTRHFRKIGLLLLAGVLGWWGYSTFLAPSNGVTTRNRVTGAATRQLMAHDWEAALATVDTGLADLPGDWELLVWQSALLDKVGRSGTQSLAQAEKQAAQPDVLIELGTVSAMLAWPEKSLAVGKQLVEVAPELPHGYFFEAQAYETFGDSVKALTAYQEAEKRAASNPDYNGIYVVARQRIATLSTFQP